MSTDSSTARPVPCPPQLLGHRLAVHGAVTERYATERRERRPGTHRSERTRTGPVRIRLRVDHLVADDAGLLDPVTLGITGWEVDLRLPRELDLRVGDEVRGNEHRGWDLRVRIARVRRDGLAVGSRPRVVGNVPPHFLRAVGGRVDVGYPPEFPDSYHDADPGTVTDHPRLPRG